MAYLKTEVTTSLVKKIEKNLGMLRVGVQTSCQDSAKEAKTAVLAVKAALVAAAESELTKLGVEGVELDEPSGKINERSNGKYSLRYPDKDATLMAYVSSCSDEQVKLEGLSTKDRKAIEAEKTYAASVYLTFVSKNKIAKLLELKQELADVASDINESEKASKASKAVEAFVSLPTFGIDEATQKSLKAELSSKLGLDSQETEISVDEAFLKKYTGAGFAEKYININEDARLTYSQTYPELLDDGKVQLNKSFYFTVSYRPSNLGNDDEAVPGVQSKGFTVPAEIKLEESDVENYVAAIDVSTQCHESRESANEAFKSAFNEAKDLAEKKIAKVNGVVRFDRVRSPYEGNNDQVVGRRPINDQNSRQKWESTQWLDLCSGEVTDKENRKTYWSASQSFQVLTNNYAVYQEVKKLAEESAEKPASDVSYIERKRIPSVYAHNLQVILKSENWRKAVNADLYEQALYKLTDPEGEVAKHLSSPYILATEAYYSLGQRPASNRGFERARSIGGDESLESAPAKSYDGERIIVDDSNLSPHTETAAKSYTITWRPEVDLIGLIQARGDEYTTQKTLD